MAYGKEELHNAVVQILGEEQVLSLGVARSVEECAVQLFLNDDAHQDVINIIKESLSDLLYFGSFRYL